MKLKRNLLLIFFLLAGIIVGAMLASLCANVSFLQWLAFTESVGVNPETPFVLDLSFVKLSFGFAARISVVQILTIGLAIFAYWKIVRK